MTLRSTAPPFASRFGKNLVFEFGSKALAVSSARKTSGKSSAQSHKKAGTAGRFFDRLPPCSYDWIFNRAREASDTVLGGFHRLT